MKYRITATAIKTEVRDGQTWTATYQVPTFELDDNILGIMSDEHAAKIAASVINPTKDPSITVNAYATSVLEV